MTKSRMVRAALATVGAFALILGGVAVASNMGFKFVPNVGGGDNFNLSLPWNNNYPNVADLFNDLPGVQSVSRFNANATLTTWQNGTPAAGNFGLSKGDAYIAVAGGGGISTAVIVGSHDPNFTLDFAGGDNRNVAAPYHGTHARVADFFNDLNSQLGAGAVQSVSRFNANATLTSWQNGTPSAGNFTLNLGEGYIVLANSGGTGYVYPHY